MKLSDIANEQSIILGTLVGQGEQRLIFGYPEIFKADRRADISISYYNHLNVTEFTATIHKATVGYAIPISGTLIAVIKSNFGDTTLGSFLAAVAEYHIPNEPGKFLITINNGVQRIQGQGCFLDSKILHNESFRFDSYRILE